MNTRTLLLAAGSMLGMAASAAGQVRSVTLQWDPSPDSSSAGYMVFVGDASGAYQEQYDAGLRTSFVYTRAVAGQPYFFSVAAYSTARQVGPRSEEVLFLAGGAMAGGFAASALGLERSVEVARGASAAAAGSTASTGLCLAGGGCYRVESVANLNGDASALTRASDTRVFFIEGGTRVRVIEDGSLISDPALVADASSTLSGLAVDPGFAQSGYVYVGVVDGSRDGGRQLISSAIARSGTRSGRVLRSSWDCRCQVRVTRRSRSMHRAGCMLQCLLNPPAVHARADTPAWCCVSRATGPLSAPTAPTRLFSRRDTRIRPRWAGPARRTHCGWQEPAPTESDR